MLVYDLATGKFKRGWGAYGKPLAEISNDVPPAVRSVGAAAPRLPGLGARGADLGDGLVYVSDRQGNRIQVFTKQGEFRTEFFVAPWTLDRGAAGSITFSRPPAQQHMFVTDIMNNVVWILDRKSGAHARRDRLHGAQRRRLPLGARRGVGLARQSLHGRGGHGQARAALRAHRLACRRPNSHRVPALVDIAGRLAR